MNNNNNKVTVDVEANIDPRLMPLIQDQRLVLVAKSFWYFGLAILSMAIAIAVVAYIPYSIDKFHDGLEEQLKALRVDVTNIVAQRSDQVVQLADKRTGDALKRVDKTLKLADDRTAAILELAARTETDANARLTDLSALGQETVGQIQTLQGNLSTTLAGVNNIAKNVDELVTEDRPELRGLLRDSRLASAEFARTSIYVRQQMPQMLADFHGIELQAERFSTSGADVASNIKRLTTPHWYDRLLGYGLNGAIMYRQLNPATNLTVKGAQFVSGSR